MPNDCKDINCPFFFSFEECLIIDGRCGVFAEECPRKDGVIDNGKVMQTLIHRLGKISTDIDTIRGFLSKVKINA